MKFHLPHFSKKQYIILFTISLLVFFYIISLPKKLFETPYSTVVTDRNGALLGARIASDEQWRFPACDSIPEKFRICLTEFEDRYFDYHWGVNPLSILRATGQNIKAKHVVSGGSTITMQVIRLSRQKKRTVFEKVIEMILATRLEFSFSKDEILNLYASHAPFGGNVVGLDAASWRYFGHSSSQLSWAEAATLSVLPNAPAMLHLSKNRKALEEKRNRLLKKLQHEGIIDELTYELAVSEELPSEPMALPQIAPHLVSYFHKNNEGKQCRATVDKEVQIRVENLLEQWHYEFEQSDIRNMAAIVLDVKTNEVLAYCGNVEFDSKDASNQVDVIQSERSPGSTLKPFLYYAMLQEGEILPNTLVPDIPMNINGFAPQNFNMKYEGAVSASQAVIRSLNIPLVYMLRQYSVPKFHDFLKQNHIAALPRSASHYGLSLILGGAEVKLINLTTAYANMGRTILGLPYKKHSLLVGEEKEKEQTPQKVFEAGAAWQVFEALKEVNRPEEIDWRYIPTMQKIAWKTGTSYGFRDGWAIGITPKYAVGVWVGNASGEGKPNLTGARTAGPVMFDIFDLLPSSDWFEAPYNKFIDAEICSQSGHLKGRFCNETEKALILPNGLRTETCPYHIRVHLSADEQYRVYESCVESQATVDESWFVLPPAWAWYYKQYNPSYKSLPPFAGGCNGESIQPMQFIYPQSNSRIRLPKQLDGSAGELTIELAHNNRNATIYWHIDNEYITATTDFHKVSIKPSAGKHSITVVDDEGNVLSCQIEIE